MCQALCQSWEYKRTCHLVGGEKYLKIIVMQMCKVQQKVCLNRILRNTQNVSISLQGGEGVREGKVIAEVSGVYDGKWVRTFQV